MDDRHTSFTSYADDVDEFDLLLADDDDDIATSPGGESVRHHTAPKSSGRRSRRPVVRSTGAGPDWGRIATAAFVVAVTLFVVGFAVKSYMNHRTQARYESYMQDVSGITSQSTAQGEELRSLLQDTSGIDRAQLVARLEKLEHRAADLVTRAKQLNAPDKMVGPQRWLIASLEYRQNGLREQRQALVAALAAKNQSAAATSVANANARLLASDVIYGDSWAGEARHVLSAEKISGVSVPDSKFVLDPEFTSPKAMQLLLTRLSTLSEGAKGAKGAKTVVPNDGKTRGGALGTVVVGPSGQVLTTTALNEIAGGDGLTFDVSFTNQGEVQATQVPVLVTLRGDASDPIQLTGTIDQVDPGETATVKVPLSELPTFGEVLTMTVKVGPIPGEKVVDNNAATFKVQFQLAQ